MFKFLASAVEFVRPSLPEYFMSALLGSAAFDCCAL